MAASRGPHVRDLFIGVQAEADSKAKSHFKKGKNSHITLGAYKPRILSVESIEGDVVSRTPSKTNNEGPQGSGLNRPFIMGDKDVPMTLESAESIYSELEDLLPASGASGNPRSMSGSLGTGTTNPIFNDTSPVESPRMHQGSVYREDNSRSKRKPEKVNGVIIPSPDYDEDELTMDFDNDTLDHFRDQPVIEEFAGEDFAKYLSDDEDINNYHRPVYSMRSRPPVARKALMQREKTAKTEARRYDKQKRDSSKSVFKSKPSVTKSSGKGTVRNYSVNDTKLGIAIDGTIRRKDKRALRDDVTHDSYESFLQSRNGGGSLESTGTSSDVGRETDVFRGTKSKPFWKKLTIRIKQSGYTFKH